MTPSEARHLADIEQQLADVTRELRATKAQLKFLRGLLAEEAPELARAEQDAERIMDTIQERPRPQLRVLEGGRPDRPGPAPEHDRHGLHAV